MADKGKQPPPPASEDQSLPRPGVGATTADARLPHEGRRLPDGSIEGRDVYEGGKGENFTEDSQEAAALKQGEKVSMPSGSKWKAKIALSYVPAGTDMDKPEAVARKRKNVGVGDEVSDLSKEDAEAFFKSGAIEPASSK